MTTNIRESWAMAEKIEKNREALKGCRFNIREIDGVLVWRPTRDDVESLTVGDLALDCFGNLVPVMSIAYRGIDIKGKAYVGFYLRFGAEGSTSTISASIKEGEPVDTLATTQKWHRSENIPVA